MSEGYRRTELPGGSVVLTEQVPGVRSVSTGVWVRAGSVHEGREEMGICHLLEHMVFKGTQRRSAREIALVLERRGGSLDAYTTREHTSYLAKVLDEDVDLALEVLTDMVQRPLLREEDLELEREVVLEEISTVEDTPDDLVFDLHAELLWGDHPYGYSILGTRETVGRLSAADLRRKHGSAYRAGEVVVAAAGSVQHDRFVELVADLLAGAPEGRDNGALPPAPPITPGTERIGRSSAQTHLVFGARTFGHGDPRRYALALLANAFGGGMSSRLFQRVREELGLAYSVYAFQSSYRDAGVSGVYVGTRPEWADRAEATVREEMARVASTGLEPAELEDAKGQVKGQLVLGLESTGARLQRLSATALYDEPYRTIEDVIRAVESVTAEDVLALAAEVYAPDRQVVLRLGPEA